MMILSKEVVEAKLNDKIKKIFDND